MGTLKAGAKSTLLPLAEEFTEGMRQAPVPCTSLHLYEYFSSVMTGRCLLAARANLEELRGRLPTSEDLKTSASKLVESTQNRLKPKIPTPPASVSQKLRLMLPAGAPAA